MLHLGGDTGHAEDPFAVVLEGEPGCGAPGVGQQLGAGRVIGLTQIAGRHLPPPPRPPILQFLGVLLAVHHLEPGGGTDRLPGEIVLGRPDPAGDDHRVGSVQGQPDRCRDPFDVVADRLLVMGVEPSLRQCGAHEGSVRVDDLTEQELGPDRDHLNDQSDAARLLDSARLRPSVALTIPTPPLDSTSQLGANRRRSGGAAASLVEW